jgi:hypothetical protein
MMMRRREIYWTLKRLNMMNHPSMKSWQQVLLALFWYSSNEETLQQMNFTAKKKL